MYPMIGSWNEGPGIFLNPGGSGSRNRLRIVSRIDVRASINANNQTTLDFVNETIISPCRTDGNILIDCRIDVVDHVTDVRL